MEDQDGPVEVFAMTETLQKSSKVVLKWEGEWFWFLRAPTALHVRIFMIPILSKRMRSTGSQTTISALELLGDDAASSDTETIGGISDVSIGGGPISEAEPVPVVEEVSMGPALRGALRWLDTVDLTGIFGRRAVVM